MTKPEEDIEFNWVSLHNELSNTAHTETPKERLSRKIKENPLVPIGCLATATALSVGLWSFQRGDRKMSQYMMRTRVAAQGFTVMALVVGLGLTVSRQGSL